MIEAVCAVVGVLAVFLYTNAVLKPRKILYETHPSVFVLLFSAVAIGIFLFSHQSAKAESIFLFLSVSIAVIGFKIFARVIGGKKSVRISIAQSIVKFTEIIMQQSVYALVIPLLLAFNIPLGVTVVLFALLHTPLFLFLSKDTAAVLSLGSGLAIILFWNVYLNFENPFVWSMATHVLLYCLFDLLSIAHPSLRDLD
jgi:hypothetical protein